jgi:hypothetical protein
VGHDWDANGEMFFINTVTGHLWHLIHGAHLVDSNTLNPLIYEKLDTIADHYHYDRSGSWSESRDGKANSLGGGHAHIGMMIYQADQWPEKYRNKLFTLNMHGRRANVERLERNGSGYVGKHEPDVFLSDDPWFRGIEISTGPTAAASSSTGATPASATNPPASIAPAAASSASATASRRSPKRPSPGASHGRRPI